MTFYINEVRVAESDWDHSCIGLFDNHEWEGRGNWCGWYAMEYFKNVTLIAYGIQSGHSSMYDSKRPFNGGFKIVNRYYDEIEIGSDMWTEKFKASSVEEAIHIFENLSW